MKQLKPTEAYLFDLFPQDILTDIDIWVYGIKHRDKSKSVITNINTMCNHNLFAIPREILAPYYNFSAGSGWYNVCFYAWAHRHVPTNTRSRYQLFGSYSAVIITLTQRHIDFHKCFVACQHITWDENSSIPYFI